MRIAFCAVMATLSACASAPKPESAGPATFNPADFLAQAVCPDGALRLVEPACAARPQKASDPLATGRFDWGAPAGQPGYVMQAGFVADDGASYANIWSFGPPYGTLASLVGNGGEVYVVDGDTVRISVTQDGGKPSLLQGFYGAHCGGTGWVAFRDDAPTGRWATLTASLSDLPVPSACAAKSQALTRYRLEQVTIPFVIAGAAVSETLPCVIGEHYNTGSMATASALERSFWCKGVGRAVWEAWSTSGPAPTANTVPARCPGASFSAAPAPGWYEQDCRFATRLVTPPSAMTGDGFGWPPTISAMP